MIIAGLTGSIGMGKTTAAHMLRDMGVPVFCSDEAVHELMAPGGKALPLVALTFPDVYDRKTGTLDRAKLGKIVFEDQEKKKALEEIIHPLVREMQTEFLRAHTRLRTPLVVLDIPLLFETGAEQRMHYVICVSAPAFIQRQRVLSRPGMTAEKFEAILASQMPDEEKRRRADFVIPTGIGLAHTRKMLENAVKKMKEGPCHESRYIPS